MHFVYELINPITGIVGYVGITNNPNARLQQHLEDSMYNKKKSDWIQQLKEDGVEPKMHILEIVDKIEQAQEQEKYWIKKYIEQGIQLTNISNTRKFQIIQNVINIQSTDDTQNKSVLEMNCGDIPKLYYTAAEAQAKLGMTKNAFNHYVQTGEIEKTVFIGSHGYYEKRVINMMANALTATMLTTQALDLHIEKATPQTQNEEFELAVLNFGENSQRFNDKRVELLTKNLDMSYYLYDGKFMVGSLNIVPLHHDGILKFENGERGWLLGEWIEEYTPGKSHELVIIDFITTPLASKDRRKKYGRRLLSGMADVMAKWAHKGIEITNIYACGGTPEGRQILETAKFEYLGEPRPGRNIYKLDMTNSKLKILEPYKSALSAWKGGI